MAARLLARVGGARADQRRARPGGPRDRSGARQGRAAHEHARRRTRARCARRSRRYRVVRAVHASPSFPHGLRIRVVEQLPVAALTVAAGRTAVAADGVVLGPALLSNSLPALGAGLNGSRIGRATGERVHGASLLAALTVLGAAPAAPGRRGRARVHGTAGRHGGDAQRPARLLRRRHASARQVAVARARARRSELGGASYVDVRLPERPAAGFASGRGPGNERSHGRTVERVRTPRPAAALAAGLTAALGRSPPAERTKGAEEASSSSAAPPKRASRRRRAEPAPPTRAKPAPAPRSRKHRRTAPTRREAELH